MRDASTDDLAGRFIGTDYTGATASSTGRGARSEPKVIGDRENEVHEAYTVYGESAHYDRYAASRDGVSAWFKIRSHASQQNTVFRKDRLLRLDRS